MKAHDRRIVLWTGAPVPSPTMDECRNRSLAVRQITDVQDEAFRAARAFVVLDDPSRPALAFAMLQSATRRALNHGLQVWAIVGDDIRLQALTTDLAKYKLRDRIIVRAAPPPYEVPERIARWDPGPGENPDVHIAWDFSDPKKLAGDATTALLLKRAFHDCTSITVAELKGGRSAHVYSVHAVFGDSEVGPRPLPFFAKFDIPPKIRHERQRYSAFVSGFIPFNLRPNVDERRCLDAATRSVLIGDFVEQSEPLWNVVQRGLGEAPLHSLFYQALRGWHLQAYERPGGPVVDRILARLAEVSFKLRRPTERVQAAHALGFTGTPEEQLERLRARPAMPHLVGPIHGDLHAHNVQVRGSDAILIDFNSTRVGPIIADPASLEVALTLGSSGDTKKPEDREGWRICVDELYAPKYVRGSPPPASHPHPRAWLRNAIRQIRLAAIALQTSSLEYEILLAFYMLWRGCAKAVDGEDDYRRAYSLVLAQRLIDDIVNP